MFQPTLALTTRKNFEHQKRTQKLEGSDVSGPGRRSSDTVWTLSRTLLPGARNYFWDVGLRCDGSNRPQEEAR
eukprot:1057316-Pyramimonas_sp.AAC.1